MPRSQKRSCCICKANQNQTEITLHSFPKRNTIRKQWILWCCTNELPILQDDKLTNVFICSYHFKKTDFNNFCGYKKGQRLKSNSVPSIITGIQPGSGNSSETDDLEYISVDSGEENENVTNQDVKEESLTIENHELTDVEVVENNPIKSEFTNDNISQFVKEEIKESISSKPFVNNICFSKFKNEEIQKISEESRSPHNLPEVKEELVDEIDSFDSGSGDCIPSGHWIEIKEELIEEESVVDCLVKREEDKPLEVQNLFC